MLTIAREDSAVHAVQLEPNTEVIVEFERAPRTVELVVTTAATAPVFWTADDRTAQVNGAACRLVPPGTIAVDEAEARPGGDPAVYPRPVYVHIITAGRATVSVQRGKFRPRSDAS